MSLRFPFPLRSLELQTQGYTETKKNTPNIPTQRGNAFARTPHGQQDGPEVRQDPEGPQEVLAGGARGGRRQDPGGGGGGTGGQGRLTADGTEQGGRRWCLDSKEEVIQGVEGTVFGFGARTYILTGLLNLCRFYGARRTSNRRRNKRV